MAQFFNANRDGSEAGYYAWGSTAVNSGNAAAIALDVEAGQTASASAAQRARDYLVGNNQFGTSFIVGYGQASPMHPHHWGSVFGIAQPIGAVVGGPAPKAQIRAQGFVVANPFSTAAVAYEDNINDYVTSEPALDYTANSILLESLL